MKDYGDLLRRERRSELAVRTLPPEMINEYGEVAFATKTEAGASFPAAAYAYVPDAKTPSTWKLRLWATPGGGPDAGIVGAAVAALGKGFRGNKVQIPAADLPAVKAKVKAAWLKANPDKDPKKDLPAILASGALEELSDDEVVLNTQTLVACGDDDNDLELSIKVDDISETPNPDIMSAVSALVQAAKATYTGYDVSCDIDIDVDKSSTEPADSYTLELDLDVDDISQTPSDLVKMAFNALVTSVRTVYGYKVDVEVDIDVDSADVAYDDTPMKAVSAPDYGDTVSETPYYGYSADTVELGTLPPALKAQIVKNLQKQLAKETDPKKKAAIEAKIKAYS